MTTMGAIYQQRADRYVEVGPLGDKGTVMAYDERNTGHRWRWLGDFDRRADAELCAAKYERSYATLH